MLMRLLIIGAAIALVVLEGCGGKKTSPPTAPAVDPNAGLHGRWEGLLTVNWPFGSEEYGVALLMRGVTPDTSVAGGTVAFYMEGAQYPIGSGTMSDPDVTLTIRGVFEDAPGHRIDLGLVGERNGALISGTASVPDAHATGGFTVGWVAEAGVVRSDERYRDPQPGGGKWVAHQPARQPHRRRDAELRDLPSPDRD